MKNIKNTYKNTKKIDFHTHCLPKNYQMAVEKYLFNQNPDKFPFPDWDVLNHLEFMDNNQIEFSLLSISSPHINFDNSSINKKIIRCCNEEMADVVGKYPDRFGYMATLPIPNVSDTLEEIAYCMDVLKVDGFVLPTNTKGIYISNPLFRVVFEELNRRGAFITFHPNLPGSVPECAKGLPYPMMEFLFDTTRVVADLILQNYIDTYENIKWMIPHAGALLPVIVERISNFKTQLVEMNVLGEESNIWGQFNKLYFDCSGDCADYQLDNLLKTVPKEHILYGSDYPFTSVETIQRAGNKILIKEELDDLCKDKIMYKNGLDFLKIQNKMI